eukprot:scaffold300424_cov18-Prasinocladus_malaysianus.AAC.1
MAGPRLRCLGSSASCPASAALTRPSRQPWSCATPAGRARAEYLFLQWLSYCRRNQGQGVS